MDIRRATFDDMKGVIDYMESYHKTSNLSDIPFDRKSCAKILDYFISSKSTLPLVATDGERVGGVLFGTLEPYFFNSSKLFGTDLMFMSEGYGPQLWRQFREWAFGNGADRVIMGVSSDDPRACQLLEALGMHNTGGMYVLRSQSS